MIEYFFSLTLICLLALFFVFGKDIVNVARLPLIAGFCVALGIVLVASYLLRGQAAINASFESEKDVTPVVERYLNESEDKDLLMKDLEKIEPTFFIMGLQRYLQENPLDSATWITLGNALQGADNKQLSLMAYQRAYRVNPDNSDLAFAYINAKLSFDSDRQLNEPDEEIIRILKQILSKQAYHENALMLLGVAAYQGQDFPLAVDSWSKLRESFSNKDGDRKVPENVMSALDKSISQAKERSQLKENTAQQAQLQKFQIAIQIDLSEELKKSVNELLAKNESTVLFVYLKPKAEGRVMPLAALRYPLKRSEFPLSLDLSDKNSLSGVSPFSYEQLELSVRVSFSGQALPNVGDWESEALVIETTPMKENVELLIDKVL